MMTTTKDNDVVINYYDATKKGHEIAQVTFRDGLASLFDFDRVELDIMDTAIYFRKAPAGKKGLKLANSKIQLWSLAKAVQYWEGQYPLIYDAHAECYCIKKVDVTPITRALPSRLGSNRAKAKVTRAADKDKIVSEVIQNPREEKNSDSHKSIFINDQSSQDYSRKRTSLFYLKDKVMEFMVSGRVEESQVLANAYKILLEEK